MTTGKTIALTRRTFVSKVVSLLFSMLSIFVTAFLLRSKCLLISWLQSPSAVIWGPQENETCHCCHCFPIYLPWSDGTRCHELIFLNAEFKAAFSLSFFTLNKRLFSSSSLSAIRVVLSACLVVLTLSQVLPWRALAQIIIGPWVSFMIIYHWCVLYFLSFYYTHLIQWAFVSFCVNGDDDSSTLLPKEIGNTNGPTVPERLATLWSGIPSGSLSDLIMCFLGAGAVCLLLHIISWHQPALSRDFLAGQLDRSELCGWLWGAARESCPARPQYIKLGMDSTQWRAVLLRLPGFDDHILPGEINK